jgi:hypothetical protein
MAVGLKSMVLAAALAGLAGPSPADPPAPAPSASAEEERAPSMGSLCGLALLTVAAEVGRRCVADPDPAAQAELDAAVTRLDAFVLADPKWDRAALNRFKREQAGLGEPVAQFCSADAVMIYRGFAGSPRGELERWAAKLASRPGRPRWGDCL